MDKNNKTFITAMTAMMTAVIVCLSWISIPMPWGVPMTLGVFAVSLAGYITGSVGGIAAVVIYLAIGAVGAPVFAGFAGGIGQFFTPVGGFLFGYLPLAAFSGFGRKSKRVLPCILYGLAGLVLCHLLGVVFFAFVTERGIPEALLLASLPYIIKDVMLVTAASFMSRAVLIRIKGR